MNMLYDLLSFALKGGMIVVAILVVIGAASALFRRDRSEHARVRVRQLNNRFHDLFDAVRGPVLGHKKFRQYLKAEAKADKARAPIERNVFVLDFDGDIAATDVGALRQEITAVLGVATAQDEVVVRLESSGGMVHSYGLAASQLERVRAKGIQLTICVDKVAASGGYMMACVANRVIAAPFSIIGSIGVVAQVPNVHRLLEKHGVDYEEATAGEFKRTVSFLGKISEEGRRKFREQLEETHGLFKDFVQTYRPNLHISDVATGEYWFGKRAVELKLVDALMTSDEYLLSHIDTAKIFHVAYHPPQSFRNRVVRSVTEATESVLLRVMSRMMQARYW